MLRKDIGQRVAVEQHVNPVPPAKVPSCVHFVKRYVVVMVPRTALNRESDPQSASAYSNPPGRLGRQNAAVGVEFERQLLVDPLDRPAIGSNLER